LQEIQVVSIRVFEPDQTRTLILLRRFTEELYLSGLQFGVRLVHVFDEEADIDRS